MDFRLTLSSKWIERAKAYRFLLPMLGIALVFVGHGFFRGEMNLRNPTVEICVANAVQDPCPIESLTIRMREPGSSPSTASADMSARLQVSTALDIFFAACFVLLCNSLVVVTRCQFRRIGSREWLLAGLTSLFGAYLALAYLKDDRQFSILLYTFDTLVNSAIKKTGVDLIRPDDLVGMLAMFASCVLAATFACIVESLRRIPTPAADEASQQIALEDMKMRCAALRATLVIGAAVLAATVICLHALQNWALAFVENSEPLRKVAEQWAVHLGAYWTLVLVAAYVPSAVILHRASYDLARIRKHGADERESDTSWVESHKLTVSVKGQFIQIVALLAPWLSGGPIPELAKLLNG